jgi:hypothetical protein
VSAIWHDSGAPSFLGIGPQFSFYEMAEVHQEAPSPYAIAMAELRLREELLGKEWFIHNAEVAHSWFQRKKAWWL